MKTFKFYFHILVPFSILVYDKYINWVKLKLLLTKYYRNIPEFELVSLWLDIVRSRSSRLELFCKNSVLKNFANFTGKHHCRSLFSVRVSVLLQTYRPPACNFIVKETSTQLFHCIFCKTFTNTFSTPTSTEQNEIISSHLWMGVSGKVITVIETLVQNKRNRTLRKILLFDIKVWSISFRFQVRIMSLLVIIKNLN